VKAERSRVEQRRAKWSGAQVAEIIAVAFTEQEINFFEVLLFRFKWKSRLLELEFSLLLAFVKVCVLGVPFVGEEG
jgi:hypothetical protein